MIERNRISNETMVRLNLIPITYETQYPKCTSPEDTAVIKKLLAMFGELDPDNKIKSFVVSGMGAQPLYHIQSKCKCGNGAVATVNEDVEVCTECYVKMEERRTEMVTNNKHPLVNKYLHTLNEEGRINYQGEIIGVDGEHVIVQLFDWICGQESLIKTFPKEFIYSDKCKLYPTNEHMNHAYENEQRRFKHEDEKKYMGSCTAEAKIKMIPISECRSNEKTPT